MPRLTALHCYPVKSCRGVSLAAAVLDRRGLVHDREMLIVDADNRQMTQRATPKMALIETAITDDALLLRSPGAGSELRVPWSAFGRPAREVVIWRDAVIADDVGNDASAWLSDVLGERCRLVATGTRSRRVRPADRIPADVHPDVFARPVELAFPDGYPLLVVSEESLADLNRRLALPELLRMDRFRPNLVLAGCDAPFAEDRWKAFRVGAVRLLAGGPVRALHHHNNASTDPRADPRTVAHVGGLPAHARRRGGVRSTRDPGRSRRSDAGGRRRRAGNVSRARFRPAVRAPDKPGTRSICRAGVG